MITTDPNTAYESFLTVLSEVEKGDTELSARNGRTIAELRPYREDRGAEPEWRGAFG